MKLLVKLIYMILKKQIQRIILRKQDWKDEHLNRKHKTNYPWCPLCVARKIGEDNPQKNLVPPQQDPSQEGMEYLRNNYKPEELYRNVISTGDVAEVVEKVV